MKLSENIKRWLLNEYGNGKRYEGIEDVCNHIMPKVLEQEKLLQEMGEVFGLILEELEDGNNHDIIRYCNNILKKWEAMNEVV